MQNETPQVDLGKYVQILKRRKAWLILPALLIIIVGSLYAFLLPPVYRSSATILIEAQEIPPEYVRSSVTSYATHRIQTINQRIMSRVKLLEIIRQFKLYTQMLRKKGTEEVIDKMRKDISLDMLSAGIRDRSGQAGSATIAFTVSYQSQEPDLAQRVCNVLASLYLEENIKTRERHARETSEFLEDEAEELKEEIGGLQKKIADFKKAHMGQLPELMDINLENLMRLDREITDVDNQIAILQDRNAYFEGQLALIDPYTSSTSQTQQEEGPSVEERLKKLKMLYNTATANLSPDHPDMKRMKREIQSLEKAVGTKEDTPGAEDQLASLRVELAQLLEKYTHQHPEVIRLKKTIAILEKQIQSQSSKEPEENLEPEIPLRPDNPAYINLQVRIAATALEIEALKRERGELKRQRDLYQERIEMTPQVEKEYSDMRIHLFNAMKKYDDILSKLMEAKVSMGLEQEQKGERFTMIDPPILPTRPFKPNRIAILMVSLILGLGLGVGCGATVEFMDDTIRSESDLMGTQIQPVLSVIPMITSKEAVKKQRWKWVIFFLLIIIAIGLTLFLVHLYVMNLEILWLKISRQIVRHYKRLF